MRQRPRILTACEPTLKQRFSEEVGECTRCDGNRPTTLPSLPYDRL